MLDLIFNQQFCFFRFLSRDKRKKKTLFQRELKNGNNLNQILWDNRLIYVHVFTLFCFIHIYTQEVHQNRIF